MTHLVITYIKVSMHIKVSMTQLVITNTKVPTTQLTFIKVSMHITKYKSYPYHNIKIPITQLVIYISQHQILSAFALLG
jgi:hypothetical protein